MLHLAGVRQLEALPLQINREQPPQERNQVASEFLLSTRPHPKALNRRTVVITRQAGHRLRRSASF